MSETTKTAHSPECCPPGRGPGFRRTPGCPRCEELTAGAAPRELGARGQAQIDTHHRRITADAERGAAIRAHFAAGSAHDNGACGPVCTAFDW